jgi:hypothetical protein
MGNTQEDFTAIQVVRCRCTMMREDGQYDGHLSIDDKFLFFRAVPPGPGTRPMAWELPRAAIETVSLSDDEFFLEIGVGGLCHRFRGVGLEPIYQMLRPRPAAGSADEALRDDYNEVLLEGGINLFVNKVISTRGDLILTDTELNFTSSGGLEASLWKDIDKSVRVNDILDISVVGIRRQLVITTREEKLVFGGALAPRLYGVLLATRGDTVTMSPNQVLFTWSVSLNRGPMAVTGELIGSSRRLRFVPSGRINALFGLDEKIELKLYEITRVEVRGLVDKRLVITGAGQELSFQVDDPTERFEELKDFLVEIDHESEPMISGGGATSRNVDIDDLVEQWQDRLRFLDSPTLSLLGVALDLSRPDRARRGWLGIFARKVIFLPVGGSTGGEAPLVVSADDISRAAQGTAPPDHLHLGVGGTILRFLPRGGDEFAARFWSLWQPLIESIPPTNREPVARERSTGFGDAGTFNRRDAYRASLPRHVQVNARSKEQGPSKLLEATLIDLGPEGCSLLLNEKIPAETMIEVQLPDWLISEEDPEITASTSTSGTFAVPCGPVPGRIVYSKALRGSRFRHGLCFHNLSHQQDLTVRELYMSLQREEVSRERDEANQAP